MTQTDNIPLQGRLPESRVHVEDSSQRVFISNSKDACEPTVNVTRQDGVVTVLEIVCSCGQVIRIECEHDG